LDFNVNSKNFLFPPPSFLDPSCSLIVKRNEDPSQSYSLILGSLFWEPPSVSKNPSHS
jgi:hypothetical protein